MTQETKTEWLHVRLTPSEASALAAAAAREGQNRSDLARQAIKAVLSDPKPRK